MKKIIKIYNQINDKISKIDFNILWEGFKKFSFALYDSNWVYLNDETIKWDNRFIGNTAIKYNDKYLAIWNIGSNFIDDIDILTSKIIHEMFHAYQYENNEKRFPDIISGLNYNYDSENLRIKNKENDILINLIDKFDSKLFKELLILRKYREQHFPNEFNYEMKIEVVEGMAEFVELRALISLDIDKYNLAIQKRKSIIADKNNLIPIREISYNIGALFLLICKDNNIYINHKIGKTKRTIYDLLKENIEYRKINIKVDKGIEVRIKDYYQKYQEIVDDFINNKPLKIKGKYQLAGLDPMNTVKVGNYLYCKHFIAYEDEGVKFIQEAVVARIDEDFSITEIYY